MSKYRLFAGVVVYAAQSVLCTYFILRPDVFNDGAFFYVFFVSLTLSYYIFAFLLGWGMPTITLTLVKGTHDVQRFFLFLFFCFLWGSALFSRIGS